MRPPNLRRLYARKHSLRLQKALRRGSLRDKPDKGSLFIASMALFVAIAAAYFTAQQVFVARESMRRQLRAYITIALDGNPKLVSGHVNIRVKITNVGATPANHVRLSFVPIPENIKRALSVKDFVDTDNTLHAVAVYTLGNSEDFKADVETNVTENDLISSRSDGQTSVVLMKVDYVDVFHTWHMKPYCTYFTSLDFNYAFRVLPCNIDDAYDD